MSAMLRLRSCSKAREITSHLIRIWRNNARHTNAMPPDR